GWFPDAESAPEPRWVLWPDSVFSMCTTNLWRSPSRGRSSQCGLRPGSAAPRIDGVVQGWKVWRHLCRPAVDLPSGDLFSMSWHNLLALHMQGLLRFSSPAKP